MIPSHEFSLAPEQQQYLPTDEDVAFYEQHGWFVSQQVLSEEVIEDALRGAMDFYDGKRDAALPISEGYSDWKPSDGDTVRNNEFVSLQKQELGRLVSQPIIGAMAARLARTSSIRLLDDQLVYKPPGSATNSTVGWHADHAYWATCSSNKMLTAWIPFHDVDEARGPLVVIDGSHKWSNLEHTRFFNQTDLDEIEQRFRDQGQTVRRVPLTLKKGQVSFHHAWTLHASYPNRSDQFRLALAVHLQDEENHYQPYYKPDGTEVHILDESLCRKLPTGEPDFRDPYPFPVLWSDDRATLPMDD